VSDDVDILYNNNTNINNNNREESTKVNIYIHMSCSVCQSECSKGRHSKLTVV